MSYAITITIAIYLVIGCLHALAATSDERSTATFRDIVELLFVWPYWWHKNLSNPRGRSR